MPKAKLPDLEIYYEEQGSGEPVLLAPASWWPAAMTFWDGSGGLAALQDFLTRHPIHAS